MSLGLGSKTSYFQLSGKVRCHLTFYLSQPLDKYRKTSRSCITYINQRSNLPGTADLLEFWN